MTQSRAGRGNLPEEVNSFVGRRLEIAEARRLLSESRLLTLAGPGGVGKTRLALRVAGDAQRAFVDGTWFVDLSQLHDADLLAQTVAGTLGLQDWSVRSPEAVLIDHLAARRALLVFDNCEHLVAPVAALTASLLRACPGLSILATSREPLGIGGEVVMRVPPLTVPDGSGSISSPAAASSYDAMVLFEERARTAVPSFRLTDDTSPVVARICERLEGMPLPIELAAARLRALSVNQVLERLSDRFRLLTMGTRTTPSRQQTLKLCVDWSYDLCTAREQWLWARLSVFAGSFELDAIEGVVADEPTDGDLLDLVTSLVDKSILIREEADATVRYRMLDTLREYGRERLREDGEPTLLSRRHRDWYEALVQGAQRDWIGPRQIEWVVRLESEQANLREAMEFCLGDPMSAGAAVRIPAGLYEFWIVRGQFNEGRYWLDRALGDGGPPTVDLGVAMCVDSVLAALQRDIPASTVLAEKARRIADRVADPSLGALAAFARGCCAVARDDLDLGGVSLEQAAEFFRADGDDSRLIQVLYWLGFVVDTLGDPARSADLYDELLELADAHGETMWRAMAMSDYGFTMWRRGECERGTELLEQSLPQLRILGNQFGFAWCFEELAWTAAEANPERAAVLMGVADTLFAATGSPMATFRTMVDYHDSCVRSAVDALGNKAYDAAFEWGKTMSLDEAIAYALGEQPPDILPSPTADSGGLTPREREVADLVAQGMTNKAIAERLVISQRTVEGHVEHIRDKLGFKSRAQIAAWTVEHHGDG
ncbi:LuxR family transcriptional regulator [Rhodococcus sp. ABRD24]|uniref:ATP-binding protein n=1 Tax=Rhodococcus sp. ABRD24 TaxID=2507582 RepID=UPI00104033AC|nr:LuxR C-terminal-related transcriptional regulator [Rhodococcus sp. ABRD24]QBJ97480.1 LuxR family transcriptional regulator [Rhodococcus sp. ABRD24]